MKKSIHDKHIIEAPNFKLGDKVWINISLIVLENLGHTKLLRNFQ